MYYETLAQGYEELHRDEQLEKLAIIRDNLVLRGNERILDVGCGPCWSTDFFPNVVGVDPVKYNSQVIQASAEKLPFADKSFDIILCVTAIHHFELSAALREMRRVAKDGARFVITVLKKSPRKDAIISDILQQFRAETVFDSDNDVILFIR
ncbi:MAG TPA: class I SAM-dependent methyltransferase [Candidatus Nanoarchaeia archaeon]|nr:class I SAM-dependent methyltransferase [Candidatus Nanoarchaeia archaeon]